MSKKQQQQQQQLCIHIATGSWAFKRSLFQIMRIPTGAKQQHWLDQWCNFGVGLYVCLTNDRKPV